MNGEVWNAACRESANEGFCECGHSQSDHGEGISACHGCFRVGQSCRAGGYTPAEPADALEDAARAYLVEHGWKKESNWFAYQAVVNRMHEFARQEIQRREQEIAEELAEKDRQINILYESRTDAEERLSEAVAVIKRLEDRIEKLKSESNLRSDQGKLGT